MIMDVNRNDDGTISQNSNRNDLIQQQDLISNTHITYDNLNKQNQHYEILLNEQRSKQQIQWENKLKESYDWRDVQYQQYQWLRGRAKDKCENFDHELEDGLWDELEKLEEKEEEEKQKKEQWEQEHLKLFLAVEEFEQVYSKHMKQISYFEQIDEEQKSKRQDALLQQIEHLEHLEQREHAAKLKFLEWHKQKQQQTIKSQTGKLIMHDKSNESVEKNIPVFQRKQTKINQLDLVMNAIFELIEKYGTPFHVFLRPSVMENNYNDKDEEGEDEEDTD